MTQLAVKVENVWKEYQFHRPFEGPSSSLKELLNRPINWMNQNSKNADLNKEREVFWALKAVSFKLNMVNR